MTTCLTPDDLAAYVERHAIRAQLIYDVGHTPTVPAAADALGVTAQQIIKTLLFTVRRPDAPAPAPHPLLVISNGESRVSKKALARHCGVGQKQIKLAPAAVVVDLLGYPAGGVPPFGHRTSVPVIVDATILALRACDGGRIYGGGGDERTMLQLTVDELVRVVQPDIVAVS